MLPLSQVVNWAELGESVAAAAVAAILFTVVVSLGIRGMAKYVDYGQEGRLVAAYASLAVGALALLLTVAIISFGLFMMITA